ncbi:radical SAM protein [Solwaraspora sp. WMMB335]|uniref:radical SAM protein n=1 Tax=Solwaraspora sp. WMMB335 TaxID=3404118 RepID=UPI003B925E11
MVEPAPTPTSVPATAAARPRREPMDVTDRFSPFKLLTHPDVLAAARRPEPMRPINLEINPVNICNQSCTWCTYGYLHQRREVLPPQRIVELLDDAARLGVQSVTWTGGGEPTVYPDLADVVEHAAEHGLRQGMNTNGVRLTERLRASMVAGFSYVRFSVDAGSPDVYARTHRVNAALHQVVLDNIRRLADERAASSASRLAIGFSFLVDTSNVSDLAEGARRARAAGVDYFQVKPIVHYERSNGQFGEGSTVWTELERQLDEVWALHSADFEVRVLDYKFGDITRADHGRTYDVCRGNELLATVGADGSVDLCCAYKGVPEWSFGNINDERFFDIWNGERRRKLLALVDVKRCPPLCKAHEMNKLIHYINHFDADREFP